MSDDKLTSLNRIETPAPSPEARQRALDAALVAFDAETEKNSLPEPQGKTWAERLRSIVQPKRGTWLMDTRITYGIGTAAIVLLLLPLGYQFMSSTSMTPIGVPPINREVPPPVDTSVIDNEAPLQQETTVSSLDATPNVNTPDPGDVFRQRTRAPQPETRVEGVLAPPPGEPTTTMADQRLDDGLAAGTTTVEPMKPGDVPAQPKLLMEESEVGGRSTATVAATAGEADMDAMAEPMIAAPAPMPSTAPMVGGYDQLALATESMPATIAPEQSRDEFTDFQESPVKVVAEEPVSTFSIDVDTASYSYVRSTLEQGYVPAPDAVRIEELINYFDYDYQGPSSKESPFQPTVSVYPTPWNPKTQLLHIGIKGYEPTVTEDKASNLVFLLDTSGSMDEPNKLPLLKRAFSLLVNQLGANDTVSIVAYAGSAGVVLKPTRATDKATILAALDNLWAGGSTAGAEGIELAYQLAEQSKIEGGINRVILATDGDFNVGISDPTDLVDFVKQKRDTGVFLSVLGFGMGNYQDDTMQSLAQNGNGNAAYIDSFREAQKVLVEEMGSTLETIAKDVKIQIEFNPSAVSEYRLIGYETRALNREDFNNDKVDAGDIGAGHTVTAIYEITPAGSGAEMVDPLRYGQGQDVPASAIMPMEEIGFVKLRYKLPDEDVSKLIELPIRQSLALASLRLVSDDVRWATAVAAFGQKLKGSNYGDMTWGEIRKLAQDARGSDDLGYRAEFMRMLDTAAILVPDAAPVPATRTE
jgi:Ca-activated chloride channel homolog